VPTAGTMAETKLITKALVMSDAPVPHSVRKSAAESTASRAEKSFTIVHRTIVYRRDRHASDILLLHGDRRLSSTVAQLFPLRARRTSSLPTARS